jgi:lauroyl/myristoyl acyltransferase
MTPTEQTQIAVTLAAVADACVSALDPSGLSLRRVCASLRDGLHIAEQHDAANNDAAQIVRQLVETIEDRIEV